MWRPRIPVTQRERHRSGSQPAAKIFGIGLSRTGTTSLTIALTKLGYASVHFPADALTRNEIAYFLERGDSALRLSVLDDHDGITDTPVCVAFESLDAAYPGSKFILTTRDKASWLASCESFWARWVDPFLAERSNDSQGGDYIRAICRELYGEVAFDGVMYARAFDAYHDRVREYFADRPADLLSLDISRGMDWAPLRDFLGRPQPAEPFPWANAT